MLDGFDPEVFISKYIEIRDFLKSEKHAFVERMKPYEDGLAVIENALALFAKEHNLAAVKTNAGTAFPVEQMRVACEDREAWMDFVFLNEAREFLTLHIVKDAVKEFMEKHQGQLPPGVHVEKSIEWQVRRA